jgi:hypothetical protein
MRQELRLPSRPPLPLVDITIHQGLRLTEFPKSPAGIAPAPIRPVVGRDTSLNSARPLRQLYEIIVRFAGAGSFCFRAATARNLRAFN